MKKTWILQLYSDGSSLVYNLTFKSAISREQFDQFINLVKTKKNKQLCLDDEEFQEENNIESFIEIRPDIILI